MPQADYSTIPFGAAGVSGFGYPRWYLGTTAPVAGTYNVGDIVFNIAPAAAVNGGARATWGWICTTAGSPGTFQVLTATNPQTVTTSTVTTGTLAAGNRLTLLNAATGPTLSLPDVSLFAAGGETTIKNIAANSATLTPISTNGYADAAAITLTQFQAVTLLSAGTTTWYKQS